MPEIINSIPKQASNSVNAIYTPKNKQYVEFYTKLMRLNASLVALIPSGTCREKSLKKGQIVKLRLIVPKQEVNDES